MFQAATQVSLRQVAIQRLRMLTTMRDAARFLSVRCLPVYLVLGRFFGPTRLNRSLGTPDALQPLTLSSGILGVWRASPPLNHVIKDVVFGLRPKKWLLMLVY
jgi:hypothetical protein